MFQIILYISLIIIGVSLVLLLIRTIKGPSIADRILGLDSIGVTLIGFMGLIMIFQDTIAYSDIILLLSILAFVGTVAMSKFLERGAVFERE
ncbi:Na(+)/H(+) antiporter subunit F1 [Oceanobacillus piezotolerans]|uniref:Na(+)/H(+) antiporter subunit F1 n=1 Tax=Oceanobacillus piezotolerans TaxID=2448030 RepID=A0A498DGZ0_9BACI|nr:Na(+)/H(+) antiporter subunit F1 [Oceanobacillus piezotolerans]RLL47759.1 Na(+)/H(+) antiporter subunit F1 [Oceanobacillus piezotolerans]